MLAWVMMTSPVAASRSVLVAKTKTLNSKLTSAFSTARFMRHLRGLPGQVAEQFKDLPEYSCNRFAQAIRQTLPSRPGCGRREHAGSVVVFAAVETIVWFLTFLTNLLRID